MNFVCNNLSYKILDKIFFHNLNINFSNLGLVGIIGPNATGKSSLVKILTGIDSDLELKNLIGEVILDNKNIFKCNRNIISKNISYLSQKNHVTHDLLVSELLEIENINKIKNDKEILSHLELEKEILNKRIQVLSGGELQRVLLARILNRDTPFIIIDEFNQSLDLHHQVNIIKIFKKLILNKERKTIILVLHQLNLAKTFCDYILILGVEDTKNKFIFGKTKDIMNKENIENVFKIDINTFINF